MAKAEEATPPRALAPTLEDEEANPPRTAASTATRVLHVFGSTSSDYYYGVSRYYKKNAWEKLVAKAPESFCGRYEHVLLQGHPDSGNDHN